MESTIEISRLNYLDYSILVITLILSMVVGSFFGFNKRPKTAKEYLNGGNKLKVFPVTVSICASTISSIGFLGVVSEMYEYGVHYLIGCSFNILAGILAVVFYMPVFYDLRLTSAYEYLELRFSKHIRRLTSIFFIIDAVLYSGIVMYASSLAFAKMSGINLHLVNAISCGICILYTMLGGIKGVIWTDTLQAWMMIGSMVAIIGMGLKELGGISNLIDIANEGNHFKINTSFDPFTRASLWAALFGCTWYGFGVSYLNQSNVQRFNSLSSKKDLKWACILVSIGCGFLLILSNICGLVIYGIYANCDPVTAGKIDKPDELLPMFVLEYGSKIPGFAGIFIAGLYSAALSSMASKLNSVSGVLYNDLLCPILKRTFQDKTARIFMKVCVVVTGVVCLMMGIVIEMMGQVMEVCFTLQSISYGAVMGLFTLGMFSTKCNTRGACVGAIAGAAVVGWICIGAQQALATGSLVYEKLPLSVDGCSNLSNLTSLANEAQKNQPEPFILYTLSYMYYALLGSIVTFVVGIATSYVTGSQHPDQIRPEYITPPLRKYLVPETTKIVTINNDLDVDVRLMEIKQEKS